MAGLTGEKKGMTGTVCKLSFSKEWIWLRAVK